MNELHFSHLAVLDDMQWGQYAFESDFASRKVPVAERPVLIQKSMDAGVLAAEKVLTLHPYSPNIEMLCRDSGLHIEEAPQPPGLNGVLCCAAFFPPVTIRLYTQALNQGQILLSQVYPMQDYSLRDLLLAHEFYHFLEGKNAHSFTTRYQYVRQIWGIFSQKLYIKALEEIAAMSFARKVCGVPFNPFLMDYILAASMGTEWELAIYSAIQQRTEISLKEVNDHACFQI